MSWNYVTLGEVATVGAGNSAPQDEKLFVDGSHNFYRTSDVGRIRNGFISDATDKLNAEGTKGLKLHPKGTVLFPKSGASTFLNHRVMLEREGYVSSHLATIKANNEKLDDRFMLYFLTTVDAKNLVQDSNYPSLKTSVIKNIRAPLPQLTTQKKIVAKLDAIFAEIDKAAAVADANAKNAEALFQSYLRQCFEADAGWVRSTIGDVLSVIKNGINCKQNKISEGDKVTRIETIAKKRFDFERVGYADLTEAEKERSRLLHGDILFSHINSPVHVGKTAIYEADEEIYHGINLLLLRTKKYVNPHFFNKFLNHLFATGYWERHCKKSVNQASVNQKDISKVAFCYPPLPAQEKIVARLDALLEEVTKINEICEIKVDELSKLKQSVLKQAFSGDLVRG